MNKKIEVEDRLIKLILANGYGDINSIKMDSRLGKDLGMDSLSIMELNCDIEVAFEIKMPDFNDFASVKTVNDIIRIIINQLNPIE